MLTIFAIPKPFTGIDDIHQRNAINSWKQVVDGRDIVLIGGEETQRVARELGVECATGLKTNTLGTPLVSSAFEIVHNKTNSPYLAYANCDMILFSNFKSAFEMLRQCDQLESFFATTRRIDLALDKLVDFQNETEVAKLKQDAATTGVAESLVCKDVMLFPRDLFEAIPDFAVGRGNWDNWMVFRAKQLGVPVIRINSDFQTIHQSLSLIHI